MNKLISMKWPLWMAVLLVFGGISQLLYSAYVNRFSGFPSESYPREWKTVDSLENLGLTAQASKKVEQIYMQAKSDKNTTQIVKSLIYRLKHKSELEEDAVETYLLDLDKEIASADPVLKSILYSLKAEVIWGYYEADRWSINERTQTDLASTDIKTWDASKFMDAARENYMLSLQNDADIKRIKIEKLADILLGSIQSRELRPTLYDFLAHRALDFFMNEEANLNRPVYAFELDDSTYFSAFDQFIKLKPVTKDTLSPELFAFKLFQDILSFHSNSGNTAALIDADMKRLDFIKSKYRGVDGIRLHLNALIDLEARFKQKKESAEIKFKLAQTYQNLGQEFEPLKNTGDRKDFLKRAVQICDELASDRYLGTNGRNNASLLKNQITKPQVSFLMEKVLQPDQSNLCRVNFKNVSDVYFSLYEVDYAEYTKMVSKSETVLADWLSKKTVLKTWSQKVPDDGFYHQHSAEMEIPALKKGFYVLMLNHQNDFSENSKPFYSSFFVSNLSFINRSPYAKGTLEMYVLDRSTGVPVKNAEVKLWQRRYDYASRTNKLENAATLKSDNEGYVRYEVSSSNYLDYTFTIKTADDFVASDNHIGLYKYNENERERIVTHFFTDRAIYRPGQTVYFKGIKILNKGEQRSLITSANVSVLFRDANYQQISILTLKTNEFGSFNGSFVIPMGLATGSYTLSDNQQGSVNIQVEEYKRPKFEVNIEKPKEVYRVNDLVKVKGNAKALAGFNITNAKVAYRVYRTANYPDWCRWWPGYGTSEEQELNFGTTVTDENGDFYISFPAIPDRSVSESSDPTFTYRISVEVTDDAGETRTAEQSIIAGYKTIQFNNQIPELVKSGNKKAWFIGVNNLNGEAQKMPVHVKIERLSKNRPMYRTKPWSETDIQLFSEEEYRKKFPLDQYSKQYDLLLLSAESTVYNKTFNTADTLGFIPEMKTDWTTGQYRVVLTAIDPKGKEIKSVHFFTLYDEKEKVSPLSEYMKIYELQSSAEPGENAQFLIMSAKKIRVLFEIEHRGKIIKKEWVDLNKEQKILSIPVIEDYRGNIQIHFSTVVDNRSHITSKTLSLPYTNKQLSLKLETFRDKMLPGSKEEWKLNVSALLGEKETAELLLGMYDASLDAFVPHGWFLNLWNYRYGIYNWNSGLGQIAHGAPLRYEYESYPDYVFPEYEHLNWFGYYFRSYGRGGYYRSDMLMESAGMPAPVAASEEMERTEKPGEGKNKAADKKDVLTGSAQQEQTIITDEADNDNTDQSSKTQGTKARSNFNETAFFFPQIKTDENGNALFSFIMPESLTRWKFMALAHTRSLKTGILSQEVITQKELMINTFAPRFLREGDELIFTAKVTNLTQKELSGDAILELKDPVTDFTLASKFGLSNEKTRFTVKPGQSVPVEWKIKIPVETNLVKYTVKAICADYSDGEENVIPILTNRMLVTETVPLWVNGKDQKSFSLPKLLTNSPTRKNHKLSLEFTSNPAWYAVQSLPYLMEYPYECAEQTFSRLYANSIASHIANSDPKIKAVFDSWKNYEPSALQSKLEKNEELKNILLEETPWVRDAKNQTERMHRMSILFDINTMKQELASAERKLFMMQTPNGGFPWFAGGKDDRYITQHILAGFGKMRKLGITENEGKYRKDIHKAILYLDQRIAEDYAYLVKYKANLNDDHLGYLQMHYLYTRSFFLDIPVDESVSKEVEYYKLQAAKYWNKKDDYGMGMLAIAMHRNKNTAVSKQILASLKDRSIYNEELGMYWKGMLQGGYYWYNAPIETMALLIEAFDEVNDDQESIDKMRRWLLKNKQTNDWKTTKATADAIYALLLQGTDYLLTEPGIEIAFGKNEEIPFVLPTKTESGTGYFKTDFYGSDIKPEMAQISITKKTVGPGWGAMYWQYFEQMDKVTKPSIENPLMVSKKLFKEVKTDKGIQLVEITDQTRLEMGDRIISRIILVSDRPMEYVHLKDMRASGLEPENVLSSYKYQQGLGYYESTRDVATHFFISYVPRGTYIFEYPSRVTHRGDFSNGITQIQCMYAPEFTYQSEGVRVNVK